MSETITKNHEHRNDDITILLVDDTPANLEILISYLREKGYITPIARNGKTALKRAKLLIPDLILLDVMMPGIDGFETCKKLKENKVTRNIPVIFISALDDTFDKLKGFEVGGVDYIAKPFDIHEVLSRVNLHLSIRAMHSKLEVTNNQLQTSQDKLQRLNSELEDRVHQRTAQLKKSYEKLKISEEKFKNMANLLPQIIYEADINGNLTFVNKHAFEYFGYSQDEFKKGINVLETLIPEDIDRAKENIQNVLLGKVVGNHEYTALRKDGSTFSILIYSNAIYKDSKPVGLRGVIIDITGRKQAEKEVLKLSTAIEQSSNIIVLTDTTGNIIYVNPKFNEITGYDFEEVKGKNHRVLKSGEMDDGFYSELWESVSAGNIWKGEISNKKKDGTIYWEKAIISPIVEKNGNIINYLKISEDITDQKKIKEELKDHQEHLEELVEKRTEELKEKNTDLEKLNKLFINREHRIKELRDELKKYQK